MTKHTLLVFAVLIAILIPIIGSAQDQFYESRGIRIRYVDSGQGTPVVLSHGYLLSLEMWMEAGVIQNLSKQYRVIAMDSRGHGRSGKPHDTVSYGREMVEDFVQLLKWLDIENAHFIGYSMGAELSLKLATEYPDKVRSLVLVGSGWSGADDYELYLHVADSLEKSASFGPMLREMTPAGADGPTDEEVSAADELLEGQDIEALVATARAMDCIINVSQEELTISGVPVLGIAGEHDPERGNLEKMAGVVADFTINVLDGRDHMNVIFDPQFNSIIMKFLSEQQ